MGAWASSSMRVAPIGDPCTFGAVKFFGKTLSATAYATVIRIPRVSYLVILLPELDVLNPVYTVYFQCDM